MVTNSTRRVKLTKLKPRQPSDRPRRYAARIWHWRAKKYLYAADYGFKGFPVGR